MRLVGEGLPLTNAVDRDAVGDLALAVDAGDRDPGVRNAVGFAPVFFSCMTVVLVREAAQPQLSTPAFLWTVAFAVIVAGSVAVFVLALAEGGGRVESPGLQSAVLSGATLALLGLAVYPWVFASRMPAMREMQTCLAALPILGATPMFSGLRGWRWAPPMVPLSWIAIEMSLNGPNGVRVTDFIVPSLIVALLAIAVTYGLVLMHRANADDAARSSRRLHELAAARDCAEEADHDKSRFLAIASHDLRQPLHALGLFAAALEKRLRGTAQEPIVTDMVHSVDGLNQSFNALMDVSQLDAGSITPRMLRFPLRDVFRRLHMHFAGQAELAGLTLRFSAGGKSVTTDPQLLERILSNLIQNALKYTVKGGVVVVARTTTTHFNIEVWDTGLGISELELPRVFHEYYQINRNGSARARGLGMGLAIVKRLIRLLGHDLTVVSSPGYGSMFRVSIPCGSLSDIEDATAAADTLPMPLLGQRTALVVDDDMAIRHGLTLLLTEWGYRSIGAASHDEACYALRVAESVPDLILCDLHLGDGPDGIAVIRSIRRQCARELPAILITGDSSGDEIARTIGSDLLVLAKPVQPRILRNALRSLEETGQDA